MQNIYFDDSAVMSAVLGINDRNIPYYFFAYEQLH